MGLKRVILKATRTLAAMNTPFQVALLRLPTELIAQIIEHVEDRKALKRLARTCKVLQDLAEPVLYRHALIRDGESTMHMNTVITKRPARAKAIHELDVPCNWRTTPFFHDLGELVESARNLKRLMIESPECNTADFEDEATHKHIMEDLFAPFKKAICDADVDKKPLQRLQELVLHLNGADSPYWTIDLRSISLFQLPSLQRLTLSCVNIEDDVVDGIRAKSFTSLKHLYLEESNITHKGLLGILSLPKALETVYLGENSHNLRNFEHEVSHAANYLFRDDPAATLDALSQQKQSLRTLTYVAAQYYQSGRRLKPQRSAIDAGFAGFPSLESVTLFGQCPNFERAVMSSRSPPVLQTLAFHTDETFWAPLAHTLDFEGILSKFTLGVLNEVPFLRAPSCSIPPTLSTLQIIGREQDLTTAMKRTIEHAAQKIQKMGVKLEVQMETRSHYFPPYLYGEPLPKITTVFDGQWQEQVRRPRLLWDSSSSDEE